MPCYRCGARQVDPDRGQSPWRRGVRQDVQVLICPGCQSGRDWTADLDHCPRCGSAHLVRRLGETECRDCAAVIPPGDGTLPAGALTGSAPGLSEEVALALERVLSRGAVPDGQQVPGR